MENEQSTNQKCLNFLEGAEEQRQKLSESLEEEFEVLTWVNPALLDKFR